MNASKSKTDARHVFDCYSVRTHAHPQRGNCAQCRDAQAQLFNIIAKNLFLHGGLDGLHGCRGLRHRGFCTFWAGAQRNQPAVLKLIADGLGPNDSHPIHQVDDRCPQDHAVRERHVDEDGDALEQPTHTVSNVL